MTTTRGTKEYAESNVNCFYGCENNCLYCYAKFMALRFGRIETEEEWGNMIPNDKAINKQYRKRKGRIMFPTSHDITFSNQDECEIVLNKLLESGNEVLIVSKPDPRVIMNLCDKLHSFKEQLEFRFTITTFDNEILKFFEPNAPSFEERTEALKYAFESGFRTSISLEPYLTEDVRALITMVSPFVNETIWLGVMRADIANRLISKWFGDAYNNRVSFEQTRERTKYAKFIRELYRKEKVKEIVESLRLLPLEVRFKVRLKDSIRNLGFSLEGLK